MWHCTCTSHVTGRAVSLTALDSEKQLLSWQGRVRLPWLYWCQPVGDRWRKRMQCFDRWLQKWDQSIHGEKTIVTGDIERLLAFSNSATQFFYWSSKLIKMSISICIENLLVSLSVLYVSALYKTWKRVQFLLTLLSAAQVFHSCVFLRSYNCCFLLMSYHKEVAFS